MQPPRQSNRTFGLIFAGAFLVITSVWWLIFDLVLTWLIVASAVFALTALIVPGLLLPFNLIWRRIAWGIAVLNTHLVLSLLFFLVVTPVGLFMKIFGRDSMKRSLKRESDETYWIAVRRQVSAETLADQF